VVGFDGSDSSKRAAHWAADEARSRGRGLALVHAILPPVTTGGLGVGLPPSLDLIEQLERQAKDQLDAVEEEILGGTGAFSPGNLIRLRRDLLHLRKSLVYEREILVKLCRRDSPYVSEKAIYHFRDIYDHLAKYFEVIEICRELIASIIEIHLAKVNNQMALVGNKTNQVVRRLTMITVIFMPLTLLASIGGMSEWSMMTGPQNWRIAYPAFLVAIAAIAVASYVLLRWFDARDKTDLPGLALLSNANENPG